MSRELGFNNFAMLLAFKEKLSDMGKENLVKYGYSYDNIRYLMLDEDMGEDFYEKFESIADRYFPEYSWVKILQFDDEAISVTSSGNGQLIAAVSNNIVEFKVMTGEFNIDEVFFYGWNNDARLTKFIKHVAKIFDIIII